MNNRETRGQQAVVATRDCFDAITPQLLAKIEWWAKSLEQRGIEYGDEWLGFVQQEIIEHLQDTRLWEILDFYRLVDRELLYTNAKILSSHLLYYNIRIGIDLRRSNQFSIYAARDHLLSHVEDVFADEDRDPFCVRIRLLIDNLNEYFMKIYFDRARSIAIDRRKGILHAVSGDDVAILSRVVLRSFPRCRRVERKVAAALSGALDEINHLAVVRYAPRSGYKPHIPSKTIAHVATKVFKHLILSAVENQPGIAWVMTS